jgi:hypothetical protein
MRRVRTGTVPMYRYITSHTGHSYSNFQYTGTSTTDNKSTALVVRLGVLSLARQVNRFFEIAGMISSIVAVQNIIESIGIQVWNASNENSLELPILETQFRIIPKYR